MLFCYNMFTQLTITVKLRCHLTILVLLYPSY